jgi:hypothetical protein
MTSTIKQTCSWCGKQDRRTCGLLAFTGQCGLPDPRLKGSVDVHDAAAQNIPMNEGHPMAAARAALARLQPCGAHARTTGMPCRKPPCRGSTRCANHGGRSTGPKPKSGRRTLKQQQLEHWLHLLRGVLNITHGHEKPPPIETFVGRRPDGSLAPVVKGDDGEWRFVTEDA